MSFQPSGLYEYAATVSDWPHGIYDGDTYRLDVDRGFRDWMIAAKVRLADVDCPSIKGDDRPAGLAARDRVRELLGPDADIVVTPRAPDPRKYGRYLIDLAFRPYPPAGLDSRRGWHDLADVLLDEGHAVPY
jgi:micrococcal nuclease